MTLNDLPPGGTLARRAEPMNLSVIREILKVTERPGLVSFAAGLPAPATFPVQARRDRPAARGRRARRRLRAGRGVLRRVATDTRTLRLSFLTATRQQIDTGIAAPAAAIRHNLPAR